jgi:hypothetical protein
MCYSDFLGEWEYVKGVEGVGDVGEGDHEVVRLANYEVPEGDFSRHGNEGSIPLESPLDLEHVLALGFPCLVCLLLLEDGELIAIENTVAVCIELLLVCLLHLKYFIKCNMHEQY